MQKSAYDQPLPHLTDLSVGIGTLTNVVWLPGFIGPCPSTSLDKSLVAIHLVRKGAEHHI